METVKEQFRIDRRQAGEGGDSGTGGFSCLLSESVTSGMSNGYCTSF